MQSSKTYFKSEKASAPLDILKLVATKTDGYTTMELTEELGLKESSVRNYIEALLSRNLIEKQGEKFIVGQDAAQLWSRRIAHLQAKKQQAEKSLKELGGQK